MIKACISNGAKELCESFKQNVTLEFLDISSCEVSKSSLKFLADGLNQNDSIKYFNASMNNFSMKDMTVMKTFLNNVHSFVFAHNCFDMNGIKVLTEVLSHGKIQYLNLTANDINSSGMTIIAKAIQNSQNLRVLNLSKTTLIAIAPELCKIC